MARKRSKETNMERKKMNRSRRGKGGTRDDVRGGGRGVYGEDENLGKE